MADAKISALSAATVLASTDELVVVDKSDTTMAASGTDKRLPLSTFFNDPYVRDKTVGESYFMSPTELIDSATSSSSATGDSNRIAIQDKLDRFQTVFLPGGHFYVTKGANGSCISLNTYNNIIGRGKEVTILTAVINTNAEAVIASRLWAEGVGTTDNDARQQTVANLGVNYNWKNGSTGVVQQVPATAGTGYGIALCSYQCKVINCYVICTKVAGILIDTSDKLNVAKGETIENKVIDCETKVTGTSGIKAVDSGSSTTGGATDSRIEDNEITYWNTSGTSSESDSSGIYVGTAGGWYIAGNHLYGYSAAPSWASGYGSCSFGHGIYANSAYGTRIIGNQIADFGYINAAGGDGWSGIKVQGYSNRHYVISSNVIWHDKARMLLNTRVVRAIFVNTIGGTTGQSISATIVGNIWNQRENGQTNDIPPAPNLRGIKVVETGTGSYAHCTITGNCAGAQTVVPIEFNDSMVTVVHQSGNSWQANGTKFGLSFNIALVTDTTQPVGKRFFNNSTRYKLGTNLTGYEECQLTVNVQTAGAAASVVGVGYMLADTNAIGSVLQLGSTAPVECSVVATGVIKSGWIPLAAAAGAEAFLALYTAGGDGALSPAFGIITVDFR